MRTSSTVLDSSTGFVSSFEVDSGDITPSTAARILERIPGVSGVRVRRRFTRTEGIRVWFHYRDRECAVWEPFGDNDCYTVLPIEGVEPIDLAEIERAFREHPPLWNRRLAHLAARRTPTMLLYTTAWISAVAGTLLAPGLDFPLRIVFLGVLYFFVPGWADLAGPMGPASSAAAAGGPRRRWNDLFVLSLVGGLAIGILMLVLQARWMEVVFFSYWGACGVMGSQLRCPRCGQPLLWRPLIGESRWLGYWSPLLPRRCPGCDLEI